MAADPARVPPRRRCAGFSLVEVLVSMLLFSIGVLGLIAMQAKAIQQSVQATDRNRAAQLASEITSQMWLQKSNALPAATLTAWKDRVADASHAGLPSGVGDVSTDANGVTTITIDWQAVGGAASEPKRRYFTQVTIR